MKAKIIAINIQNHPKHKGLNSNLSYVFKYKILTIL
jgi:hypothetical protein